MYRHAEALPFWRKKPFLITLSLVLVTVIGLAIMHLIQRSEYDGKAEMRAVRSKIEKLILLPTSEEPTLATVEDASKLTDPALKKVAKNGDKVLVYVTARKAFIYRPDIDKVVDVQPVTIEASAAQIKNARITIWSGSSDKSKADQLLAKLKPSYPSASFGNIGTANRQDYPHTIIIDLTEGDKYDLVGNLMQSTGAQRGILPQAEAKPENTDILIITGIE